MNAPQPHWPAIRTPASNYIANRWDPPAEGGELAVIDPSDGAPFAAIARGTAADVDRAVRAAQAAREGAWGKLSPAERGRALMAVSNAILANVEELTLAEARDCGKPLKQARADVVACARYFEFYAGACDKLHGTTLPYPEGYTVLTWREPHGVTGHIIPWNYPLQIFGRSVGGALAAGNACVVKPAEDACLSLLLLTEIAAQAGLPAGAINIVTGLGREAGAALVEHPGIAHISFTGSPATVTWVAAAAAKRHCPVTLELGGKSPQIVFDDADLDAAVVGAMASKYRNAGQTCVCANRILVQDSVFDAFAEKLVAAVNALKMGNGADQGVTVGPLINDAAFEKVSAIVKQATDNGATVLTGGKGNAALGGNFYEPTVLVNVNDSMEVYNEEIFGPVAPLFRFKTEEQAIRIGNDTPFGLSAYFYSRDIGRIWRVAEGLDYGIVGINEGIISTEVAPFGGVKESGIGREGSKYGIDDYLEIKYLCMGGVND